MEIAINQKEIENRIFTIRGNQVMIDRDLAEMYGIETKVLNQAVKRNIERFPGIFQFQLTENEYNVYSRSQIMILNDQIKNTKLKRGQNIKYLPYAFTEQGVAMLSAVLRSETAVKVSIQIMNAFVEMRKLVLSNAGLFQRLDKISVASVKDRLKIIKDSKVDKEERNVLESYLKLAESLGELNRHIKEHQKALETKVWDQYKVLTDDYIKTKVVDHKWIQTIDTAIHTEMQRISQRLIKRIKDLAVRNDTHMPCFLEEVGLLEQKANAHIEKMGFVWK